MRLLINGKEANASDGSNIITLLQEQDVRMPEMVSVELNGDILDSDAFENTTLHEDDKVEFLYFMGGGALWHNPVLPHNRFTAKP